MGLEKMAFFKDRLDAGRKLAKKLSKYANRSDILILGLPRGGVPVAFEVAKELNVKMDVFVVRKLGVPGNEELAMGAIASDNIIVLNEDVVNSFQISKQVIDAVAAKKTEIKRRNAFSGVNAQNQVKWFNGNFDRRRACNWCKLSAQLFQLLKLEIRLK